MADDDAEETESTDDGGGKSKKKLIIIIAAVVLLIAIGGAVGMFMLGGGEESPPEDTPNEISDEEKAEEPGEEKIESEGDESGEEKAEGEETEKKEEKKADDDKEKDDGLDIGFGDTFPMKTFNLNLGNALENRFVRLEVTMEFSGGEKQKAEISKRLPQLRDAVIQVVSRKTREFLLAPDGKDALRKEILIRINRYMNQKIDAVYITDILIE
ncbi:MAG: flagellar basal body-associated FliL family protein [Pseudobacteriovorax sp.]|nr:flagellar basal body-associated FliL family protein [Pseudobacteriovorax sp.]